MGRQTVNQLTHAPAIARFYAALRSNDVDAWLAVFAENAVAHDPVGAPPHRGRDGLTAFLSGILQRFETFGLTEDDVFQAPFSAAVKWTGRGRGRNGRPVEFHGIDVFEFDPEGKISSLDAYWDAAPVMATLAAPSLEPEEIA